MKLTRTTRNAGWLVVAGLLGAALIAPSGALATAGGNPPTSEHECGGYDYYLKIETPFTEDDFTAASWPDQTITLDNLSEDGQTFDWAATEEVLRVAVKYGNNYSYPSVGDGFSGTVDNQNQNGISHVTFCGDGETTTTTTTTTVDEVTTTVDEVTTTTTVDEVTTTKTKTKVTGTVSGETGKPTPPSTDTVAFSSTSSTTGSGWSLILIAMAGLLAGALLLTPAAAARKR